MHLDLFHKSTACLPGELWVTTSCPLSKQGVQEACMAWHVVCCQQTQHALVWAAFSLHMAWSAWHLQLQGAMMPMGYKTWANPDVPLLAKHLAGLSESPSQPGDNYLTRHCSLSPPPPSRHANKGRSVKGHGFLPRICSAAPSAPLPAANVATAACAYAAGTLRQRTETLSLLFLMGTAGFCEAHRVHFLIRSRHCGLG